MVTLMAVLGAISFGLWVVGLVIALVVYRKMAGQSEGIDLVALKAQQAAAPPTS